MIRCGIYAITHVPTGRRYVGLSRNIMTRWKEHIRKAGKSNCFLISRAIAKHGVGEFRLDVLELCKANDLCIRERFWIDHLRPEFNLTDGGEVGYTLSTETRARIASSVAAQWATMPEAEKAKRIAPLLASAPRAAHSGYCHSAGTKRRISEKLSGRRGHVCTNSTRVLIGAANGLPVIGVSVRGSLGFVSVLEASRSVAVADWALRKALALKHEVAGHRWYYCNEFHS